jgi:hypothetical protein
MNVAASHDGRTSKYRRRPVISRLGAFSLSAGFLVVVILWFGFKSTLFSNRLEQRTRHEHMSAFVDDEPIVLKAHNDSIHYIYIDIGCFDGESIEHFLWFVDNSSIYTIITFEPDPDNYRLCEQTLRQEKYSHMNIVISRRAVWIRDEEILFRAGQGSKSRIETEPTSE